MAEDISIATLKVRLADKNQRVRAAAERALGEIGGDEAVRALMSQMRVHLANTYGGGSLREGKELVASLIRIDSDAAHAALIEILNALPVPPTWSGLLQKQLMAGVAKIGSPAAVEALVGCLTKGEYVFRGKAHAYLEELRWVPESAAGRVSLAFYRRDGKSVARGDRELHAEVLRRFRRETDRSDQVQQVEFLGYDGDPAAAHDVIQWLLNRSPLTEPRQRSRWHQALAPLLGDYAVLAVDALNYVDRDLVDESLTKETYRNHTTTSDEAIRRLTEIDSPVSSNLLRLVLEKPPREFGIVESDYGQTTEPLDDAWQRELAAETLKDRGDPSYDPAGYLAKDAFRIPAEP